MSTSARIDALGVGEAVAGLTDTPKIRAAGQGDHEAIWHILKPVFRAGDTYAIDPGIERAEALAYWMGERAFVAEAGGAVVGTYYLRRNQGGGGAHVCNCGFVTDPEAEGRGVAQAMLDQALVTAKEAGFQAMQFNFVLATNQRAIAIWQKAGFEIIGRQPKAFLHPDQGYVDALMLHKYLK